MKKFDFTLQTDSAEHPAIGLVVLQSDESMEHELKRWLPEHYRLFHTRIPNDQSIGSSSLQAMKDHLPSTVSLLPSHTRFDVIVYGCTSASTVIGEAAVETAIQSVFPAARVTNPLTAIKAQLEHLQAKRIALLTPYVPDVSAAMVDQLEHAGLVITDSASFHEALDHRVARISQQSLIDAIVQLNQNSDNDAIIASCTNLRTFELLEKTSALCGCPVISSNSAVAWHIQALVSA